MRRGEGVGRGRENQLITSSNWFQPTFVLLSTIFLYVFNLIHCREKREALGFKPLQTKVHLLSSSLFKLCRSEEIERLAEQDWH